MPNSGPKSTIYIASIPSNLDRSDAYHFFEKRAGFKRFCFHQDYAFVVFNSPEHAKSAIDYTHANSDMLAAYAKNDIQPSNINNMVQLNMSTGSSLNGVSSIPAIAPNPTLYIAIPSYFTDKDMSKIVKTLEGLEHIRYFPGHCLVRFQSTALAAKALELLSLRTNLSMNFSSKGASKQEGSSAHGSSQLHSGYSAHQFQHTDQVSSSTSSAHSGRRTGSKTPSAVSSASNGRSASDDQEAPSSPKPTNSKTAPVSPANSLTALPTAASFSFGYSKPGLATSPKRTIHVANIIRDKTAIKQLMESLPGFQRIAFYLDYCFVVFDTVTNAAQAIEGIVSQSKMKASFAKADFTPHDVPPSQVGTPNLIVRVSDYPSFMTEAGLRSFFSVYEGAKEIHFYHSSCLIHFNTVENAEKCLRDINKTTNFVAVFSRKGAAMAAGTVATNPAASSATPAPPSNAQQKRSLSGGWSGAGVSLEANRSASPPIALGSTGQSDSTTAVTFGGSSALSYAEASVSSSAEPFVAQPTVPRRPLGNVNDGSNTGNLLSQLRRNLSGEYVKTGQRYEAQHDLTSFLFTSMRAGVDSPASNTPKPVASLTSSLSSCSLSSSASNASSNATLNGAATSATKMPFVPAFPAAGNNMLQPGTAIDFSFSSLMGSSASSTPTPATSASNAVAGSAQTQFIRDQWEQQRLALTGLGNQVVALQLELQQAKGEIVKLKSENRELRTLLMIDQENAQQSTADAEGAHISPLYVSNLLSIID